jgi:serine/threonine-protein kinase
MSLPARSRDDRDPDGVSGTHRNTSPVPGQLIGGKYRVDALIAEGGMGIVYRATHLDLDCPVALKLIRPEHVENEEVVARLLTEARIAAGLRSKHVNRVLDVGRTASGMPYLVLEFMEGSDLRAYLERRGRLPIGEAVDCVMQACEALAEAHAFGIVHRDLKPENLFLSEEADGGFVLKVLDFGISKAPAGRRAGRTLTNPFEVVGSPNYMTPEQIRGGQVDERADIWALGALLYELCTGNVPFAASTVTETFSLILDEQYELPALDAGPGSEHLRLVLDRCLRKNPDERYQNVTELADALSPLGSDMLQGRRVAKVAVAARARVIAAADQPAPPAAATPVALSTSLEPVSEELEPLPLKRRSKLPWLVGVLAACSLLGIGFQFVTQRPSLTISAPNSTGTAAPRIVLEMTPAAAPLADGVTVPPPPELKPQAVTRSPAPANTGPARPWRPGPVATARVDVARAPAAKPAPVVIPPPAPMFAPIPLATPEAPPPEAPPPEALQPPEPAPPSAPPAPVAAETSTADAWDPKTFGGRR